MPKIPAGVLPAGLFMTRLWGSHPRRFFPIQDPPFADLQAVRTAERQSFGNQCLEFQLYQSSSLRIPLAGVGYERLPHKAIAAQPSYAHSKTTMCCARGFRESSLRFVKSSTAALLKVFARVAKDRHRPYRDTQTRCLKRCWSDDVINKPYLSNSKNVVPIRYRSAQLLETLSVSGLFASCRR